MLPSQKSWTLIIFSSRLFSPFSIQRNHFSGLKFFFSPLKQFFPHSRPENFQNKIPLSFDRYLQKYFLKNCNLYCCHLWSETKFKRAKVLILKSLNYQEELKQTTLTVYIQSNLHSFVFHSGKFFSSHFVSDSKHFWHRH